MGGNSTEQSSSLAPESLSVAVNGLADSLKSLAARPSCSRQRGNKHCCFQAQTHCSERTYPTGGSEHTSLAHACEQGGTDLALLWCRRGAIASRVEGRIGCFCCLALCQTSGSQCWSLYSSVWAYWCVLRLLNKTKTQVALLLSARASLAERVRADPFFIICLSVLRRERKRVATRCLFYAKDHDPIGRVNGSRRCSGCIDVPLRSAC